jgi:hypothetical protein
MPTDEKASGATRSPRHQVFVAVLELICERKRQRPGLVTRGWRQAIAKVPMLTPDFVADAEVSGLLKALGVSAQMIEAAQAQVKSSKAANENQSAEEQMRASFEHEHTPEEKELMLLFGEQLRMWQHAEQLRLARTEQPRRAALAKADRFKGKADRLRAIWQLGKYPTKERCADKEHKQLGLSFHSAVKALNNAPRPNPWPARARLGANRK